MIRPLPSPDDVRAALELGACPWCGERAVAAPVGPRRRCRECGARWELTPHGGIIPVPEVHDRSSM